VKKFIAAFAACVATLVVPAAHADSTVTTDFTDLWWIPAESGWGANVIQQQDVLFISLFVYGTNTAPIWFTGSDVRYQGLQNGQYTFTGGLFQTSGPYFGAGSFSPGAVGNRQVGSITFRTASSTNATITYTVDGVSVTKNVERQSFRAQTFSGSYRGGIVGSYAGCNTGNGAYEAGSILSIQQSNNNLVITEQGSNYSCTYTGTYTASGNSGLASGTGSCTDGFTQTWAASEMKVGLDFFAAAWTAQIGSSCRLTGRIGGVRRN
jgi:hypothetical protein